MIIREADRIRELARYVQDPMDRTLNLGVIPTLGPYYLPHAISIARRAYPRLRLFLREDLTPHLLVHLAESKLDAALIALPVSEAAFEALPLFVEPFLAGVPAGHPLADAADVSLDDPAQAGLLLLEEGHCLRDQALEACHLEGLQDEEVRATSLETLRQMVGLGLGVTLFPLLAGPGPEATRQQVVLRRLAAPGASRTGGRGGGGRSPPPATLTRLAETLAGDLPEGVLPVRRI